MINLKEFMDMRGEKFRIIRNDFEISIVEGMHNTENNTKRKYIGFYPDTDVQSEDWVISTITGERFYIEDTKTDVVQGKALQKKGYCWTKVQYVKLKESQTAPAQFNIGNVFGSIIGTQGIASMSNNFNFEALDKIIEEKGNEDKAELRLMILDIKELLEDSEKVKKGSLSRFSELLERHSWITGAVAQLGLSFLIGK